MTKVNWKIISQLNLEGLGGFKFRQNDVLMSTSFC